MSQPQQPYQQQPQQFAPHQPYQAAPPAPPAKKPFFKRVSTWVGAVVAVVVIGALAGGGGGTPATPSAGGTTGSSGTSAASGKTEAAQPPAVPGFNTAVRSGDFEVTVTKVETGVKKLGKDPIDTEAKGQFIVVSITVKNVGDKAELVSSGNVKLKSGGQEFEAESSAILYLGKEAFVFEKLNPGSTLKGKLAFDVPADFKVDTLEFSGGFLATAAVIDIKG